MWSLAGRSQSLAASSLQRRAIGRFLLPAASHVTTGSMDLDTTVRSLSSGGGGGGGGGGKNKKFHPRRRPAANYRPTKPRGNRYKPRGQWFTDDHGEEYFLPALHKKDAPPLSFYHEQIQKETADLEEDDPDGLSKELGPHMARGYRYLRRQQEVQKGQRETVDDYLRDMDYLAAAEGSQEELAYERRALSMECDTDEEREKFMRNIDEMVERQKIDDLELEDELFPKYDMDDDAGAEERADENVNDPLTGINPNQKAFGEWGELVIRVDRNIKLWRGGRIQSYRALVIGGNLNGCAGFGTGKAPNPRDAVVAASRKCKRNIFFVDRYQQNSLTRDLMGRNNSCKVVLRATHKGLRGNPLIKEILKYFGITNCTARCEHGNRSQFNVVRATFKALMTHESMEDIARKRGRRLVSIDRGRKLAL